MTQLSAMQRLRSSLSTRLITVCLMMLLSFTSHVYAVTTVNLISNPSFEMGTVNAPTSWNKIKWGNHTAAFTTPTTNAQDGSRSSRIEVSQYVSGDSRWNAPSVPVAGNETYILKHWYKSSVTTQVNAEVIMSDNSRQYFWLGTMAPSSTWKQSSVSFTVPADAKQANLYHLISSNGWLETDNYNLYNPVLPTPAPEPTPLPAPTPAINLIANASLESGDAATVTNWSSNSWGSLTAKHTVTSSQANDGVRAGRVDVTHYATGDSKWYFNAVAVKGSTEYQFTNSYKSNVPTTLTAAVTMQDKSIQYLWIKNVPASSTWTQTSSTITPPAGATSMTIFHLIASVGWLEVDNYNLADTTATPAPAPTPPPAPVEGAFTKPLVSIEFDDGWGTAYRLGLPTVESFGWKPTQYIITQTAYNNPNYGAGTYMNEAEIKDWNRRADIGSHSVTHASIPSLPANQIATQLTDSKKYLDTLLGEPTNLYASPYCESSQAVIDVAKTLYQSVRNCDLAANTKANFNRWDLKSFIILNTTSDAEIRAALNDAKASNGWLILVWHEIDGDNKNPWSVSQATLKRQLQIVKDAGIEVTTTQSALDRSTR